jgi:hypothetical protein
MTMEPKELARDHEETLLAARDAPLTTFAELVDACHRALSAHLWGTCLWPEDAEIGEFEFLIVECHPREDACLYLQFWSEPEASVITEVASGERAAAALRFVGPVQRQALAARGYAKGGEVKNFRKTLVIDSPEAAEAAALQALEVIWEVFGYRGLTALELQRERSERAEVERVHTSLTPHDFARVALSEGWGTQVIEEGETPMVALKRGRRVSFAHFDWRSSENLFSAITLQADLTSRGSISDETIARLNTEVRFIAAWRTERNAVRVRMPLHLDGGVTVAWVEQALAHWQGTLRECDRRVRKGSERGGRVRAARPVLVQ